MAVKETTKSLRGILDQVVSDLEKAEKGNKAASQRVRTGTIRLEKIAKAYRKESVQAEKGGGSKKAKTSKKGASAARPKTKKAAATKAHKAAAPKAKKAKKSHSSSKRATAKLPKKR